MPFDAKKCDHLKLKKQQLPGQNGLRPPAARRRSRCGQRTETSRRAKKDTQLSTHADPNTDLIKKKSPNFATLATETRLLGGIDVYEIVVPSSATGWLAMSAAADIFCLIR
jgi:hypothetical protein